MRESGKRFRSYRDDSERKNQRRRTERDNRDRDEIGNNEPIVYRILCPSSVIGSVIGKNGKVINSIRDDSRAKVKVMDPVSGAKDRVITVYCYIREKKDIEPDDEFNAVKPLCSAQDALLKVHAAIANAVSAHGDSDRKRKDKGSEECQLLVPSSQSANIIGKSGATIKKLRNKTRTSIKVTAKDASDPIHSCALEFDNFVVISGESESVKKAIFAVSTIMYKFSPKEKIPLESSVPEGTPSIIIPPDVPLYTDSGLYDPIISGSSLHHPIIGHTRAPDVPGYAVYSPAIPMVSGYDSTRSEELTIRVLCPSKKIGHVIGKGGSSIKSIRQESGARIEVEDVKSKREEQERLITVITTESPDDLKSMAVEAVLLLQYKINDDDDEVVTQRLLVPSKVIGCIIGKSGSIINDIRKRTRANIRISKADVPHCAGDGDELIEISGLVGRVRDALIEIVLRLREDVLKDREGSPFSSAAEKLYSGSSSHSKQSVLRSMPPQAALAYEPIADAGNSLGLLPSRGYGYGSLPIDDDGYGSLTSHQLSLCTGLPSPSTLEMVIPAHAVGKVMGKGGTNIENIRKISGASINVSDSKSSRGDRVALISGTAEQKRSAENLIQAFIMST